MTAAIAMLARLLAITAAAALLLAGRAAGADGLQPGNTCSGPGEPSFVCGYVFVTVEAGTKINTVVEACQPLGTAVEARPLKFMVSVPVGSEIALRDCYRAQPGVREAELGLPGMVNSAVPQPRSTAWAIWMALVVLGTLAMWSLRSTRQR